MKKGKCPDCGGRKYRTVPCPGFAAGEMTVRCSSCNPYRPQDWGEVDEIERQAKERSDAAAKRLFGSAAGAKHPRLS